MELPVFDMAPFFSAGPENAEVQALCRQMAECMHESGVLVVKDPRVSMQDNETFLSMLERYFEQPDDVKLKDARPEIYYQIGVTPEFIENARCGKEPECLERIDAMPEQDRPHKPLGPDAKERFFWRMGERPAKTDFPTLNAEPVVPANFPEWTDVMNLWGAKLLTAVSSVAEMLALGLGLDQHVFTQLMHCAPHLLAPTGTNLAKHGKLDTIYAGFHYDLSFLTIHGKSRFPGLYIWLRNGKKMLVRVPDGCLLVQGGKQLEILTGGHILAGYHEVVCAPETLASIERAKANNTSTYRISSTLFSHIASDNVMQPLGKYGEDEAVRATYPPIRAGDQVQAELNAIKLAAASSSTPVLPTV